MPTTTARLTEYIFAMNPTLMNFLQAVLTALFIKSPINASGLDDGGSDCFNPLNCSNLHQFPKREMNICENSMVTDKIPTLFRFGDL